MKRSSPLRVFLFLALIIGLSILGLLNFQSTSSFKIHSAVNRNVPSKLHFPSDFTGDSPGPHVKNTKTIPANFDAYFSNRKNIFFDEKLFLAQTGASQMETVHWLGAFLKDASTLLSLDPNSTYMKDRPSILLKRMAAIDMIEMHLRLSESGPSNLAESTLREMVLRSEPEHYPNHVRSVLTAEKYDALSAIARSNPHLARDIYQNELSSNLKNILRPSLVRTLRAYHPDLNPSEFLSS